MVDSPVRTQWIVTQPGERNKQPERCNLQPYLASITNSESMWSLGIPFVAPVNEFPFGQEGVFGFVTDFWNRRATEVDVKAAKENPTGMFESLAATAIVPSWMNLMSLVLATLSSHERLMLEFENMPLIESEAEARCALVKCQSSLAELSRTRRRTWWYMEHLHAALQNLGYPSGRVGQFKTGPLGQLSPAVGELAVIIDRLHCAN